MDPKAASGTPKPGQVVRDFGTILRNAKLQSIGHLKSARLQDAVQEIKAGNPCSTGKRLPTKYELSSVAAAALETSRRNSRKSNKHIAYNWYYPDEVRRDVIIASDNAMYMRKSDTVVEVNLVGVKPQELPKELLEVNVELYCVTPVNVDGEESP